MAKSIVPAIGGEQNVRNESFRNNKIYIFFLLSNEAISSSDLTPKKNTVDMEQHVFSKARSKDEYLSFVARLIIHVREMSKIETSRISPSKLQLFSFHRQ